MCATIPFASSRRYTPPRGESSSPRAPFASAMRMCWLEAAPPSFSKVAIAASTESDSRAIRSSKWMGKSEVEIGRARMAFKHTPTDCELNPIFPTIPG